MKVRKKKVLIVDDESIVRESLQLLLSRLYEIQVAADGSAAIELLAASAAGGTFPDIVLLDVMMPGVDGLDTLQQISEQYPRLPVIMLTASTTLKTAVDAMKIGAVDYLSKPFDVDELLSLIEETLTKGAGGRTAPSSVSTFVLDRGLTPESLGDFGQLVGTHPLMEDLFQKIDQVAARDTTILITGESGTGKELVAREIHLRSTRAQGPFIALNCAAIPESLIESELFGHEKGAFTHAMERRLGQFELAHRGTLFLDEIGELSLPIQVKMLRFLQEQQFYRVGNSKATQVDVRILAATNRNLELAIEQGKFRQDLYYRINVVSLEIPPLRQRCEDVPRLLAGFVRKLSATYSGRVLTFSDEAKKLLMGYSWPGNVRELENVVESLLALTSSDAVEAKDLPSRIGITVDRRSVAEDVLDGVVPFEEAERAFETELILKALERCDFVQTRAAQLLGISRRILKYKMDKLGISQEGMDTSVED
jgi:two-component system response regulator AtoC